MEMSGLKDQLTNGFTDPWLRLNGIEKIDLCNACLRLKEDVTHISKLQCGKTYLTSQLVFMTLENVLVTSILKDICV